jgi:hypothetical protein
VSIALSSLTAFTAAVAQAQSVDLCAYTLHRGRVVEALAAAARGGAHVRVRLASDALDASAAVARANRDTVAALVSAGADAAVSPSDDPLLHMKAAVIDGSAWLDDRNWAATGPQTIVRDEDPADVATLEAALAGASPPSSALATSKVAALAQEVALIRAADSEPLAVESESFGAGSVSGTLRARADAGFPTRLLVAGREARAATDAGTRERALLRRLAAHGVEVRLGHPRGADLEEKLAVARGLAWAGSANATDAHGSAGAARDWGLILREPRAVDDLRAAFEANWRAAVPL